MATMCFGFCMKPLKFDRSRRDIKLVYLARPAPVKPSNPLAVVGEG